jgi:RNA polymerase sigma-70 factor (ECF subfamily)
MALQQVAPIHQEVILAAYYGGHTQIAIAKRTGLPLGTVKSRTLHGLAHLRDRLDSSAA